MLAQQKADAENYEGGDYNQDDHDYQSISTAGFHVFPIMLLRPI